MKTADILITLILIFILLDQGIKRMYQNKKRVHQVTPAKYSIEFEEIRISLESGGHLYGWWIPYDPEAPTLILVHGWSRNLSRMLPYIRKMHPLEYNLLAFDTRNHGSSSPVKTPSVWTFTEDICEVVKFLSASNLVASQEVGVIGLSVGGGAAINAAALDQRIQGVVTVGALSHPVEVMKLEFQNRHIPYFPLVWGFLKYLGFRFGLNFNKIAPVNNIGKARAKILLVHGELDDTIPLEQGKALLQAGNPETTELWVVPGKGHGNCHEHPEFWGKVGAFLAKTFTKGGLDL